MVLLETSNALQVAYEVTRRAPESLSKTSQKLYLTLVAAAIETAKGRGYSAHTTHVTMHIPLEVLASVVGLHRVTLWRNLPALRDLGLIDYRAHKGTLRGETRNTGTLFQVRLSPISGSKARLSYDDLKHQWRNLDQDVKRKRTAYRQLRDRTQQSIESSTEGMDIKPLLQWTLPLKTYQNPVRSDCCTRRQISLEAILDVKHAPKEERNGMVALAAEALSQALADQQGTNWYRKLLWQLLRRFDATGEDYSYQVYLMATRSRTDALEGFARKPGALFNSRIKEASWYDEIMKQPQTKVGTIPG